MLPEHMYQTLFGDLIRILYTCMYTYKVFNGYINCRYN